MHAVTRMSPLDCLPPVRGEIKRDAPLSSLTWFRTGGRAEILFRPADAADLAAFLAALDPGIDVTVIGLGANLLVRDGGVGGVVVVLGKRFSEIAFDGAGRVTAGAGALGSTVARACRDQGLTGAEFLSGIPGTIGGGLRMNAGAYGAEVADIVVEAEALDRLGVRHVLPTERLGMSYRRCAVPEGWIFVAAQFEVKPGDADEIARRMAEIADRRRADQPVQVRTGGSTFKNPPEGRAWELIDAAGCRNLSVGGAHVSPLHCNFLVNDGGASAADIERLGEEIRSRVLAKTGVVLEWEIRRIGAPGREGRS